MDDENRVTNTKFDKTEEMFMNFNEPDVDPELKNMMSNTAKGTDILA